MGRLEHCGTQETVELVGRHLIGRASTCETRLDSPRASGFHAELTWSGSFWAIRDLGSRNGTFVDGVQLPAGRRRQLRCGTELIFGTRDHTYRMRDASAPRLMARSALGAVRVGSNEILALPRDDHPLATIFRDGAGRWLCELDGCTQLVDEEEPIVVLDEAWRIFPPVETSDTGEVPCHWRTAQDELSLQFRVSRDQEHIAITCEHAGARIALEPRAHALLLLLLARTRLTDAARAEIPASEHGWIHREDLLTMLRIDANLLNLWVFRSRQQLASAGLSGIDQLIERRPGASQLRIGAAKLVVESA